MSLHQMDLDDMLEDNKPEPGRELDALVAEYIMGWYWNRGMLGPPAEDKRAAWATEWDSDGLPYFLPKYSTDPAAMWEVIQRLVARYDFIDIQCDCGSWFCLVKTFMDDDWLQLSEPIGRNTPMKAVCYAALETLGIKTDGLD